MTRPIPRLALLLLAALAVATPLRAAVPVQEVTSPGGITAWLVEDHGLPFAALELRFRGGAALDARGREGAVSLMVNLLEEGAGDLDSTAFQTARQELAAEFDFSSSVDSVSVSARFLTENRDAAIDLLRLALVAPRFDAEAVERVRAQTLAGLARDALDPGRIANRTFDRIAFEDHPYGAPSEGTVESVGALTREEVVAAHRAALTRDRVLVGVSGDITAAELGPLLDRLLGGLPAAGAPLPPATEVAAAGGIAIERMASPQSVAVFGHGGIDNDDPDFFAAFLLNRIVGGGGFSSRLMSELREKRGLTYGVATYLAPMDRAALIMGQLSASNGNIAEAVRLIREEWARVAENGVTAEELDAAKRYATGSFALRFSGNGQIARMLAAIQFWGRPIDYLETRNELIEAVTLDEANRVARRLFRPDRLQIVVVGEPEGLTETN